MDPDTSGSVHRSGLFTFRREDCPSMMGIESTVAASDTAPLSATNRSRAVSDHRVFSGVGRRARRRVGQSRRTALVRVLHPAPSQIGPRSPLPCVQGTHERNGGKPEYYDALHLSGDPTPEHQLRAARPRPRPGPEWRLRHGLPAGLWSAADVRTAGDLAGPESAARIRSDHTIPRSEFIREALLWLDKYLGPVSPAAAALQ
jgi:hypothetical protein